MPKLALFAETLDRRLNSLLTNREVLRTASVVINLNSYRRKWTRAAVRRALTSLELPVRTDQERMLALLEQLNDRLEELGRSGSMAKPRTHVPAQSAMHAPF